MPNSFSSVLAHFFLVDAFGAHHRVHLRQLVLLLDQELQAHRFEAGLQREVVARGGAPRRSPGPSSRISSSASCSAKSELVGAVWW